MLFNFKEHTQKATLFLKEVAEELESPDDLAHAGRVLTAVLHSLRDMITHEESMDLCSELPLYVQAVYMNGWKISKKPNRLKLLQDFLWDVKDHAKRTAERDFGDIENTRKEVEAVFRVLNRHVSSGEMKDVKSQLPEEISQLI